MGCVAPTCTGCCGPKVSLRVRGGRAADLKAALQGVQVRSQEGVANVAAQKQRLETQLANERIMFEFGDLSQEEYIERRGELIRLWDAVRETDEWEAVLARAAAFLSDLPAAWRAADGAQCNALARMLFASIRIKDDWVEAVEPQPSFAPFFSWDCQVRRLSGGSDGDRGRVLELFVPRRIAIPDLRTGFSFVPRWRSKCGASARPRYRTRTQKLTTDQDTTIRALAGTKSLRTLAADFDVSHETIRAVIRERHVKPRL
jgi:hypothetical protein